MTIMADVPTPSTPLITPDVATYDAHDLVKSGVQARIVLNDQIYVLRITRAGKLILTK